MANRNEALFLEGFLRAYPMATWLASLDKGRILNVGSAEHGQKKYFDPILKDREVLGIDLLEEPGVNIRCDMTGDCRELEGEKFAMVVCCSVLEHCEKPWRMAENIQHHMLPFGLLYVTVPWVWRTHNYPKDYWRMSPDAVKSLFPLIRWKRIAHSTLRDGEFIYKVDHDDQKPWRIRSNDRSYIACQQVHMIGRMS